MRKIYALLAFFAITLLTSCEIIGDIFKAGVYTGIIIVIIVFALIIWIFTKFRGRG